MSGPVTYSVTPFASTVTVGDQSAGGENASAGINVATVTVRMFGGDSIDDGTAAGRARAEKYMKQQVDAGVFKQADIDKGAAIIPREVDPTPPPPAEGGSVDCTAIHQGFNMNTKLSPTTTLGDFINKLVAIPNCKRKSVPAQMGLSPDQIVCNLAHLCVEVWEPIKARYPNAIITNTLRVGSNVGAGPHGTGQGMDIQFNVTNGGSIPPKDYFAIAQWIKSNISFNQMLLEYSTVKGYLVAWIHISIYAGTGKQTNDASRVLTFMNNKTHSVGLSNLAN